MKDCDVDQFSENFMLLIPLMQNKIFSLSKEEMPKVRLSESGRRTLVLLHEVRRAIVSELSDELNISRPNMTPLLDKLVQQGLVCRQSCEEDRRHVFVEITSEGDQVCEEYHQVISSKIKDMISFLNEDDLRELNEHMNKLKSILIKSGDAS